MEREVDLSNFVRHGKTTTKNTLVCFTWVDLLKEPKILYLDDVKVVFTENIIIVLNGSNKEVIVERKLDVTSFYVWRLDAGE